MPDDGFSARTNDFLQNAPPVRRPLRVAVLVDLAWTSSSGGHLKCWERLAAAAARTDPDDLDLTIHVQDRAVRRVALASHVRIQTHRPLLSTERFGALDVGADHTDLAPVHPGLLRHLAGCDVVHTTDAFFAYAKTAMLAARLWRRPLVTSIHTDTPAYTRVYSERILRRLLPGGLASWAIERRHLPERLAHGMRRKLDRHVERAAWTFVGAAPAERPAPWQRRVSVLRRGIDRAQFSPQRRDRARLAAELALPPDRKLVLFVGRLDDAKGVRLLTLAAERLIAEGRKMCVLYAGQGKESDWIIHRLGPHARLLGQIPAERLAEVYASSDLFVLPSEVEVSPNVVLEAKASGLASVVAPLGGGRYIACDGGDGLLVDSRAPEDWAAVIGAALDDDVRRAEIGRLARADIVTNHPTWDDVLAHDLLPVWESVGRRLARHATDNRHVWATASHPRSPS